MIKGAQKRMIVVKTADSPIFEEVYFVMRRDAKSGGGDMVSEANRIIGNCGLKKGKSQKRKLKQCFFILGSFVGGSAVGGAVVGLIGLFL